MSDLKRGHCGVCGREYQWGCGHTRSQERDVERHQKTRKHQERRCRCFGHDYCDPKTCELAGIQIPGYMPFYQHTTKKQTQPGGSSGTLLDLELHQARLRTQLRHRFAAARPHGMCERAGHCVEHENDPRIESCR